MTSNHITSDPTLLGRRRLKQYWGNIKELLAWLEFKNFEKPVMGEDVD